MNISRPFNSQTSPFPPFFFLLTCQIIQISHKSAYKGVYLSTPVFKVPIAFFEPWLLVLTDVPTRTGRPLPGVLLVPFVPYVLLLLGLLLRNIFLLLFFSLSTIEEIQVGSSHIEFP